MSVGALNPIDHPEDWNRVTFKGTITTPGKAEVGAWNRENEYDIKTGKGTAGATETLKGKPPAKGPITFTAWTRAHFNAWNLILPIFAFVPTPTGSAATPGSTTTPSTSQTFTQGETKNGNAGGTASGTVPEPGSAAPEKGTANDKAAASAPALTASDAIKIFHPALADIGVRAVLPPEKLGSWVYKGSGEWERTIEFVEFVLAGPDVTSTPNSAADQPADGDPGAVGKQTPTAGATNDAGTAGAAHDGQGATVPAGFGG